MSKKDYLRNMVIIIFSITILILVIYYIGNKYGGFVENPEFVQDTTVILNSEDKEWIEEQIIKIAKKEHIGIVLDCQRTEFEVTDEYITNILKRVLSKKKEQKFLIVTYFADTNKIKISSNLESENINFYQIEDVSDTDEMLKEVIFIVLREINNEK